MTKLILALFTLMAAHASAVTIEREIEGVCTVYTYSWGDTLHTARVPFRFSETASVNTSNGHEFVFGAGTAQIDENIEIMDTQRRILVKPFRATIQVKVSADKQRKALTAQVSFYDIFSKRQVTLTQPRTETNVSRAFEYFQLGVSNPNSSSQRPDEVGGLTAFCDFLDENGGTLN